MANPATARAELEADSQRLFAEANTLASAKCWMEAAQREYNFTYGLTPAGDEPTRRGAVCSRGRVVFDILGGKLPTYNNPAANMRAAQVAYMELATMEGEECAQHEKHMKDLIAAAIA
ncbi:hypothetical protein ZWY2020_033302 [Hordeum vulgare]|nr:hypothetical protein ZWY2020_033302 [Hordeum vulgare]